jgi:uncharacterized protein (TIGR00725 family)
VVGPGEAAATPHQLEAAEEVGRLLAEAGAVVVCGGLGGAMEAACRGARSAGGTTVGILPGRDRADANRFVEVAIATGLGEARNALVARAADVLVAVGGGYGTLSEIALALKAGTPVVGLGTWELARAGEADSRIVRAADPHSAAETALELARQ